MLLLVTGQVMSILVTGQIFILLPRQLQTLLQKMAHGICDNLLLATYFSATCPIVVAPAMDLNMYKHPATVTNTKTLMDRGNVIIPAVFGELASGLTGEGKMAEPEDIIKIINNYIG